MQSSVSRVFQTPILWKIKIFGSRWLKPGLAQALPGARFLKSEDLDIQKFGIQKMSKMKILKIQIRSAQNVGKVWISRNKNPSGPIRGHLRQFFPWAEQSEKIHKK